MWHHWARSATANRREPKSCFGQVFYYNLGGIDDVHVLICADHTHLRNIDCLTARTTCLVCFISTVNGHSKRKKEKKPSITSGASSGHITKLKQSIILRCPWCRHTPTSIVENSAQVLSSWLKFVHE
jgi:hypothetical protein